MSYDYKGYNGERKSLPEWVFHAFNKYGYDIGLQVRDKRNGTLRSSQKIYYEKGDKYAEELQKKFFEYCGLPVMAGGRRTAAVVAAQFLKRVPCISTVYVGSSESRTLMRIS